MSSLTSPSPRLTYEATRGPSNKGMKLTKPGELRSFAAYPRCSTGLLRSSTGRVSRAWTRRAMERRTEHAATPPILWLWLSRAFPGGSWTRWAHQGSVACEVPRPTCGSVEGAACAWPPPAIDADERGRCSVAGPVRFVTSAALRPRGLRRRGGRRETGVGSGSVNGLLATESQGRESGRRTSG